MEPIHTADREPGKTLARRGLLAYLASAAAALGLGSATSAAGQESSPTQSSHGFPTRLEDLPRLRTYRARRSSSADPSGGNADFIAIEPGATATIFETPGPGTVTHIWFTIASDEAYHLKKLVLRAFWDGENEPSVEVPVGDFFGLTLGDYFSYQSALTSVASIKALNAYFPMPFAKSARITITNEGKERTDSFYYNIDYIVLPELPSGLGYFHA
ncbi:MAG: DUF2961 domain-containing protein, partial [Candidatus Acidiferrales bacterium]